MPGNGSSDVGLLPGRNLLSHPWQSAPTRTGVEQRLRNWVMLIALQQLRVLQKSPAPFRVVLQLPEECFCLACIGVSSLRLIVDLEGAAVRSAAALKPGSKFYLLHSWAAIVMCHVPALIAEESNEKRPRRSTTRQASMCSLERDAM